MRPPPGGMSHTVRRSSAQARAIINSMRGGRSPTAAGGAAAAAGGAAGRAAGDAAGGTAARGCVVVVAAGAGVAADFGESALTAVWQLGESLAELRCRHCSASAPPGVTPEQFDMKSAVHDCRIAACCSGVGAVGAAAAGAAGVAAEGVAGAGGTAVRGGAAAAGGAGGCVGAATAGFGVIAATAPRHAGDSFAELCCRHCSASAPPGVTPEQFDMKSERQDERIAFCCSAVGCAMTGAASVIQAPASAAAADLSQWWCVILFFPFSFTKPMGDD